MPPQRWDGESEEETVRSKYIDILMDATYK
jgi:hypothetical protein